MSDSSRLDSTQVAEDFRRAAHQAVDWIADYLADPREYPVLPAVQPGELTDRLPQSGPETGEPIERSLEDFQKLILPATTHWNHPGFMAFFGSSASGPGVLGEMLCAALNTNAMVWKSGPASTELEQTVLGWYRQWLGLPEDFFGVIYDTASMSSTHAMAAARQLADPECRQRGTRSGLTAYISTQTHSSIEKAAIALGIGQENVRKLEVDDEYRMRPDLLASAIEQDLAAGRKPFFVTATVGTTSTTSIDPVPEIADIAEQHGLWLHVDSAYGGAAAIVPELHHIFKGVDRAQSVVTNPHKWLFTPSDCSVFYTRRPDMLREAFSLIPEYLRTKDHPRAVNLMDYGLQLGRRFRSLKLWFVMRYFGHQGLQQILRNHVQWAQDLAAQIRADSRFEIMAPAPLSVVCFRLRSTDEANHRLIDKVNASGKVFLSGTVLKGKYTIRLAIGNIGTTWADVEQAWNLVKAAI
ncbi:MAG: aspartate aminotransferase family protein [Acidobacteriales bacterium]|nr:aspartate aminotransferase family protein [Terriglobales bacterium]